MRTIIRRSIMIAVIIIFATTAIFAAMGWFQPIKDGQYETIHRGGKYKINDNGGFTNKIASGSRALIPEDDRYNIQVRPRKGKNWERNLQKVRFFYILKL